MIIQKLINHRNEKKTQIFMRKLVFLGLSILEISKIVMYKFLYDHLKKYGKKCETMLHGYRLLYSLHKSRDIYIHISKDVERRFDTSKYELDRPLPKVKNKNVIVLMKDELGRKIMKALAALRANTYRYSTNNSNKDKKSKRHQNVNHITKTYV